MKITNDKHRLGCVIMTVKKKSYVDLAIRFIIIVLACAGIYVTVFGKDGFMSTSSLFYYTIQSNILVLLLELAAVILKLFGICEPEWFKLTRFVCAVAIAVTLLVFWTMLTSIVETAYLFTVSNLTLHTLVPLLTLFDEIVLDRGYIPSKKQIFFCTVPPLAYFAFAMILAKLSPTPAFGPSKYPYWFLDVDKFGWFGFENGLGVFYWVLIVAMLVLGLGFNIRLLKLAVNKHRQ